MRHQVGGTPPFSHVDTTVCWRPYGVRPATRLGIAARMADAKEDDHCVGAITYAAAQLGVPADNPEQIADQLRATGLTIISGPIGMTIQEANSTNGKTL